MNSKIFILVFVGGCVFAQVFASDNSNELQVQDSWGFYPKQWSLDSRIPMTSDYDLPRKGGNFKVKKKFKRFLIPLLLAYKLKFFTLIPVLIGGLVLLTGATGLAGFFFALFAAVMGLKAGGSH